MMGTSGLLSPWLVFLLAFLGTLGSTTAGICPSACSCKSRNRYIFCERGNLQSVPEGIPTTAEELYLGYNSFTRVVNNSFSTLTNLTTISLKGNEIQTIEPLAFYGLKNLKILYLTDNILPNIEKEVFKELPSLKNLYLSQNKLESIPDVGYSTSLQKINLDTNKITSAHFPSGYNNTQLLNSIVLTNNQIGNLKKSDFEAFNYAGCKVGTLKLGRCGIKSIENGTFGPFTKMQSLTLSYNPLNNSNVKNIINGLAGSSVVSLDLSGVIVGGILPADSFAALENVPITTLKLAHSKFKDILHNTFRPLNKLRFLDLSSSAITLTESKAFAGLDNLQSLYLRHNRLGVLPPNLPPKLTTLDLSNNHDLTNIPAGGFINLQNLKLLNLYNCGVSKISSEAFIGIEQLEMLDMSRNHLGSTSIPSKVLSKLSKLKKLLLDHNRIISIKTGYPLFKNLKSLKLLDLSGNGCGQIPNDIFTGLRNLSTLFLQGNKLGDSISNFGSELFADLGNLTSLYLANNDIKTLPDSLFEGLKSLKNMSLSSNLMTDWPEGASQYLPNLASLDLSYNQMSTIKVVEFSTFQPRFSLNLTGNPFDCWCDLRDFRQWLNQTDVVLVNLTHYKCNAPRSMEGKSVLAFDPAAIHVQCHPPPWKIILGGSLGGLAGFFAITAVLTYRYRWKLRLRWYNTKQRLRLKAPAAEGYRRLREDGRGEGDGDPWEFDAYISVCDSERDRDWVFQELLPKMDNGREPVEFEGEFKLCYDDRDMTPGKKNYNEVVDYMLRSKKVILVLSNEYLASNRHREFDLEFAASRMPERGLQYVIPLFLDHGVDVRLPGSLRLRLERIEDRIDTWNNDPDAQQVFWAKLRDLLSANTTTQLA